MSFVITLPLTMSMIMQSLLIVLLNERNKYINRKRCRIRSLYIARSIIQQVVFFNFTIICEVILLQLYIEAPLIIIH